MKNKTQQEHEDIPIATKNASETDITDEIWQAIVRNDSSYDDKFFYGVKTTGIFCRPSCKSRPPKRKTSASFKMRNKLYQKISDHANDANRPDNGCRMKNGWPKLHNSLTRITGKL